MSEEYNVIKINNYGSGVSEYDIAKYINDVCCDGWKLFSFHPETDYSYPWIVLVKNNE